MLQTIYKAFGYAYSQIRVKIKNPKKTKQYKNDQHNDSGLRKKRKKEKKVF